MLHLRLLPRRGARATAALAVASSSSLSLPGTPSTSTALCPACNGNGSSSFNLTSTGFAHELHTSSSSRWRTREERKEALHRHDDGVDSLHFNRRRSPERSPARYARRDRDGSGRPSTTSHQRQQNEKDTERRGSDGPRYASVSYPKQRSNPMRSRQASRADIAVESSPNSYKRQLRDTRSPLGVFDVSSGPQYPPGTSRGPPRASLGMKNPDRLKQEARDKIKSSDLIAKELPPLTDEDYQAMYQELLTYESAPASPTQRRLSLQPASEKTPLLGEATQPVKQRMEELLERLQKRVPEEALALPDDGEGSQSLFARLSRMRDAQKPEVTAEASSSSPSKALSIDSEEHPSDESTQTVGIAVPNDVPDEIHPTSGPDSLSAATLRKQALSALGQILRTIPGEEGLVTSLVIGSQEGIAPRTNAVTKQEWAALVLDAARSNSLTDVLTTFELMKRARVAVPENLLTATIRFISRDQRLVPILLRYFEEAKIVLPPAAHHEVVLGILRHVTLQDCGRKAERYLRALEVAGTPAPSVTYAAVIRNIFKLRNQTGNRARAWNLYGHMRLVAHPTPSVEVFDAMIYGCSLDDRVAPERALDLFAEMVELGIEPSYETYLGLIRSCARDRAKDSPFYFEALRLLKELLERGFQPERDIFNCILEGARTRGELPRAKWIVNNMLQIASQAPKPSESPLAPDIQIMQNLFLTAATYKVRPLSVKAAQRAKVTDAVAGAEMAEENESPGPRTDQDLSSEDQLSEEVPRSSPSAHLMKEATPELKQFSGTHPLLRPDIPSGKDMLLRDMQWIFGSILEVHGEKLQTSITSIDDSRDESDGGSMGEPFAPSPLGIDASTENALGTYTYGLPENVQDALRNVQLHPLLFNAYLVFLGAHARPRDAIHFFRSAFQQPKSGVAYSHASWEIVFDILNRKTNAFAASRRPTVRTWKALTARETFSRWRVWLQQFLSKGRPDSRRPPPWLHRHIETIYAHHMGAHARARELDEGLRIFNDFVARFPPGNIVEAAAGTSRLRAGPDYLVQLATQLYPETMDSNAAFLEKSIGTEAPRAGSSGPAPTASLPKSSTATYNLWGLPPMMSYHMAYSLFHRLKEAEDDRAREVYKTLQEYKQALTEALEIKKTLEKKVHIEEGGKEARKALIGLPGQSLASGGSVARTSEALLEGNEQGSSGYIGV